MCARLAEAARETAGLFPAGPLNHTIFATDVAGFGDPMRTDVDRHVVRAQLYRILHESFAAAGVPWSACIHEDRGDGTLTAAPPNIPTGWVYLAGGSAGGSERHRDTDQRPARYVQDPGEPVTQPGHEVLAGQQRPRGLRAGVVEQPGGTLGARRVRRGVATEVADGDHHAAVVPDPLDLPGGDFGDHEQFGAVAHVPDRGGDRRAVPAVRGETDVPAAADLVEDRHGSTLPTNRAVPAARPPVTMSRPST